jgi:hypothetical protein
LVAVTDAGTHATGILFDINSTGVRAGIVFDIDDTAATTGNIFDYATSAASTGTIFEINLTNAVAAKLNNYTLAGTRTANATTITHSAAGAVDIYQIDDSGTSSGHIFDINVSGNSTGNVIDIVASASKVAGHLLNLDLGTDLAGNALNIAAAGVRTAPIINIANAGTDAGTDDHVILITQSGLLDSNLIQLTFGTAASTGDALGIVMDTNLAGRAIAISSAGTGASGEGSAIDITHTGALGAGADVVNITTSGALSSTSNVLAIETTNGVAGSFALYINAGNDMEAIKVDAGTVTFDESLSVGTTLAVTGLATLTAGIDAKVIFAGTETIAAGGTTTALDLTKTVHYIDADAGGDTFTLADGVDGQIAIVLLTSSTGTATVTPANLAGGTSVTLNADGDSVILQFMDTEWFILGGNSYAVA